MKKKEEPFINGKELLKGIGMVLLFYALPTIYQLILYNPIYYSNNVIKSIILLLGEVIRATLFIFLTKDKLKGMFKDFKENKAEYTDVMVKYWVLGYILMIVTNVLITYGLKLSISGNESSVREELKLFPLYSIPAACLLGPIIEELAFKVSFKNAFKSKTIFVVFTALLFASAHIVFSFESLKDLIYIIPYSTLAFSFSMMYAKTNNPLTNIITHIIHNTSTIVLYLIIL